MKHISLLIISSAVLCVCACGQPSPATSQSQSVFAASLIIAPISAPTPVSAATPVSALASASAPTFPPSPLQATLDAGITEHGEVVASLPVTVATPANTVFVNDVLIHRASENKTFKASPALPFEVVAPTVPAPRNDDMNLSDSNVWQRLRDATGISYEYFASHQIDQFEPLVTITSEVNGAWIGQTISGTILPSPDRSIAVQAYRGLDSIVTQKSFPEQTNMDWGEANWPLGIDAKQTTDAWMYVYGRRSNSPAPDNSQFWSLWPVLLRVELYNATCQMGIGFSTSFGVPGPVVDALAKPLDQVVAEHFPVLDHMYRSVEFPPECS